jgi:hypothetical protein
MNIGDKVYYHDGDSLETGIIESIQGREISIKGFGWCYLSEVTATPSESAEKLHARHVTEQFNLRRAIRQHHTELRTVNAKVEAGVIPLTDEQIAAAEQRNLDRIARLSPQLQFRNYTGVYEP